MSQESESRAHPFDEECRALADRKHGDLGKLTKQIDSSKKMCRIGLLLSPLLIGIPLAYTECRRNVAVKHKLVKKNIDWSNTYQKCIRRKERESQSDK